jgi:hypothetical protein
MSTGDGYNFEISLMEYDCIDSYKLIEEKKTYELALLAVCIDLKDEIYNEVREVLNGQI